MKQCFASSIVAVLIIVISTVTSAELLSVGTVAESFFLPTLEGGDFFLSNHCRVRAESVPREPRTIVLVFWAVWCVPCRAELKWLASLESDLIARGAELVLVSDMRQGGADGGECTVEDVRNFMEKLDNLTFRGRIVIDVHGQVFKRYGVTALPVLMVAGIDGTIAYVHAGFSADDAIRVKTELLRILTKLSAKKLSADNRESGSGEVQ